MQTKTLYYEDQDLFQFDALVLRIKEKNGETGLLLDQTAFYPGGGGQPADTGTLGGFPLLRIEKEEGEIWHFIEGRPSGERVDGVVDAGRRSEYQQQHTGQHILSAVFMALEKLPTVSVHMGELYTSIEFSAEEISQAALLRCEEEANRLIGEAIPIKTYWTDGQGLENFHLRRPTKHTENIRIVEIESLDQVACGGLHTRHTGLAGPVLCIGTEKIRGNTRTIWKIGHRALDDYRKKTSVLQDLSVLLSEPLETIGQKVKKLTAELLGEKQEKSLLKERIAQEEASKISAEKKTAGESAFVQAVFSGEDQEIFQHIGRTLALEKNLRFCLANRGEENLSWIIGDTNDAPLDFALIREKLLPHINGKGGGKGALWQGVGTNLPGLEVFLNAWDEINRHG